MASETGRRTRLHPGRRRLGELRSPKVREPLEKYGAHPKLVGVRHVVHDEPDDNFMLLPEFRRGIAALKDFDLTYDLLLFPVICRSPRSWWRNSRIRRSCWTTLPTRRFGSAGFRPGGKIFFRWPGSTMFIASSREWSPRLPGQGWCPEDFRSYIDIVVEAFGTTA